MKTAIVHDYLNQFGGAERVVAVLHEMFPEAPIYTSIYDKNRMPAVFKTMDIRTSFMQKFPGVKEKFRYYFWLYPRAFESFDLSEYDLIISSSSAYAKGARKGPRAKHVCYCHNPMRFVWRYGDYVKKEGFNPLLKRLLPAVLQPLKKWDLDNSKRVDRFIANSKVVAERIRSIYGRESVIINPPIETGFFDPAGADKDYFLIVSRLASYKRIDVAVEAFSKLKLPLKIAGDGPAKERLKSISAKNIEFLGRVEEAELKKLYAECRGLLFCGEEDFGMAPLEAAASGRPTIAYRAGGALETIIEGKTGLFFDRQCPEALIDAVEKFNRTVFDRRAICEHALKFDSEVFKNKIREVVNEA